MTTANQEAINQLIDSNPQFMRRRDSRQQFARSLADLVRFWNYAEMEGFVEEMRGLNMAIKEDRQLFFQLIEAWCHGAVS